MEYCLVIDLIDEKGGCGHYGTLFLMQAEVQAYWVSSLHRKEHGQMTDIEMLDYIEQLKCGGFIEVSREELDESRPEKYYIILSKEHDWNIDEIGVLNNFHRSRRLMMMVKKLNMSALAHRLLVDDWDVTRNWVNSRGNFQLNHGSNHLDIKDKNRIKGMNVARDHQQPRKMKPGLDGDETIEDTLVRMQMIVTSIFDEIASIFGRRRPFDSKERRKWFSSRSMRERGLPEDGLRSDAGAFIYSGLLPERSNGLHSAQCRFHLDAKNDPREEHGFNDNICITQVVDMKFPNRVHPVKGRVAMNQFGKACNGDAMEKLNKTLWLCSQVKEHIERHSLLDDVNTSRIDWGTIMRKVRSQSGGNNEDFATLPAHGNKDCHYSWYVHVILEEIVPEYGWNDYVIIEAVVAMALTPSALGWRKGVRYALLARRNGLNFYHNFVFELVAKDDKVANHFKVKARHQVSSGAFITNHEAMASCKNCLLLINWANEGGVSSDQLYADFSSNAFKSRRGHMRGLCKVGMLTAHDMVNVLTKIEMMDDQDHLQNVTIAKNTETARRLARYGITSDAHLREVVVMIGGRLGIRDYQIVENLICETLRRIEGDGGDRFVGVDTIGVDQPLYTFVDRILCAIGDNGEKKPVNISALKRRYKAKTYNPAFKWWCMNVDNPEWELGDDFDLVLTKRSKVLKKYVNARKRKRGGRK